MHVRPGLAAVYQNPFHSRPKSPENTAVLDPQETEIPRKYSSSGSTADPKSLENKAVWVKYSTFGSTRTNLKMLGNTSWGEKPKSLEHNTEFGLSLHLSTRPLHWLWAQGVAPCKLAERRQLLFKIVMEFISNQQKITLRRLFFPAIISNK